MFHCHGKEVETTDGLKFLHQDDPYSFLLTKSILARQTEVESVLQGM